MILEKYITFEYETLKNKVVFNQTQWDISEVHRWVNSSLYDIGGSRRCYRPKELQQCCWLFPAVGWVKYNVDGSVWGTDKEACGGVLRDSSSNWLQGFCRRLGTSNPLLVELWAISSAVEVIRKGSFLKVLFESDSMEAIAAVTLSETLVNPYLEMVGAIHRAIPHQVVVKFHHTLREANSMANFLVETTHGFGFGIQMLQFTLAECRHLLYKDAEKALASLRAPVV